MSQQHIHDAVPPRVEREQHRDVAPEISPLRRLHALHDEAAETARLANVLGRTPWLAGALFLGTVAVLAGGSFALAAAPLVWALAMAGAVVALLRLHRHTTRSPFELLALRSFQGDLRAVLLYAGVAWGAAAFLAIPSYNILIIIALSAGMVTSIEAVLRVPNTALYFTAPAVSLSALSVGLGPLGLIGALLVLAAGGCVIALAHLTAQILAPRARPLLTVS